MGITVCKVNNFASFSDHCRLHRNDDLHCNGSAFARDRACSSPFRPLSAPALFCDGGVDFSTAALFAGSIITMFSDARSVFQPPPQLVFHHRATSRISLPRLPDDVLPLPVENRAWRLGSRQERLPVFAIVRELH